jgi:hypothetical protein
MRALWLPGHPEIEFRGGQAIRLDTGDPVFPGMDPRQFVTFDPLPLLGRSRMQGEDGRVVRQHPASVTPLRIVVTPGDRRARRDWRVARYRGGHT